MHIRHRSLAGLLPIAALLGGCASVPDDGFAPIEATARQHLGMQVQRTRSNDDRVALEQRVQALLVAPLTADDAMQLALLNNRGLQAAFAELGVAEADRVQAGRWPNPVFGFVREHGTYGDWSIERALHFSLGRWLMLPELQAQASQRLAVTQHQVQLQLVTLAQDTRRAWVQAVAAQEALRYAGQVQQAAEAGAELARRMAQAGNFSALQQAREQAFHADAALNLVRAQQAQGAARERLVRLLGLWGDAAVQLRLPDRLPELPQQALELPDAEQTAVAQRLDLQAARRRIDEADAELALVRKGRFSNGLELAARSGSGGHGPARGWAFGYELPIFDDGSARVARAEALQQQARHRAAELAVNARSEVREAYAAYRHAWDIARHQRDEVLPLARRISQQNLLRYNGMLIGVFELLADARAQVVAVNDTLDTLRDFWLAQAELDLALLGPPRSSSALAAPSRAAAAAAAGAH